jgi:hypothetical protein
MMGIPNNLFTKKDYYNAVEYAASTGNEKDVLIAQLNNLKGNTKMNVLKKTSAGKSADDLTADDFEAVDDPNCEMKRLGFTTAEVDKLLGGLK